LAGRLYASPQDAKAFLDAIESGGSGRPVAVFPAGHPAGDRAGLPDWLPPWVGRPDPTCGAAYGLDLSSVWEAMVLSALARPRTMLDLCAAPGGKSVLAARLLQPALQLANEVVGKRLGMLRHNLARCGVSACTQRLDPAWWALHAAEAFDLVLVDAPCSGQSLLARGIQNRGCFHPAIVGGNARRQRSILAKAAACVAPGACLAYLTCTFSLEENERNVVWFLKHHPDWQACEVPVLAAWRSPHAEPPCHRLGPHLGLGAGGFACLLQRPGSSPTLPPLPPQATAWPVAGEAAPPTRG
jgi:16S rRNA C967 or C1407 C5-methylase (RsmB/RsmF family)